MLQSVNIAVEQFTQGETILLPHGAECLVSFQKLFTAHPVHLAQGSFLERVVVALPHDGHEALLVPTHGVSMNFEKILLVEGDPVAAFGQEMFRDGADASRGFLV